MDSFCLFDPSSNIYHSPFLDYSTTQQSTFSSIQKYAMTKMATFHARSNSFPSQTSHPVIDEVEAHLCRLKGSQYTSTSSVCANLAGLRNLHEGINDLIQIPSIQQALSQRQNWIHELLEGSLRLVDLCEFAREALCLTKESVQDLGSLVRRNKGETATGDINPYIAPRNKIKKMATKYIKNLKSFNKNSTGIDSDLTAVAALMKEMEDIDFSVLKSVLILLSGERERSNGRNWSILTKFTQGSRAQSEAEQESGDEDLCSLNIHRSRKNLDSMNMLKQLKATEMTIQELEEGLEAFLRSFVKTRVSLLNVLSH